ncbi:hypothetical protein C437_01495 [Haloarcula vallismortis ATCC 29715]|uniref:Zinc-ribbon domain-containing protein n=1 Tax=Haloarcula vallismortis ATCC 29715 TaxID=662477 RepID=M0JV86_HALVA|nr:hypothetical protein C437_01495 [Haloarcula vallismortis ATCC 29715]
MSSLLADVKQFLRPSDSELYECRRCGTILDKAADKCPSCGFEDIARYEF